MVDRHQQHVVEIDTVSFRSRRSHSSAIRSKSARNRAQLVGMALRILGSGFPELLVGETVAFDVLLEN
jgi:hypothetical protein